MIIGSHVSFSGEQLKSSTLEAISYGANAFMFYTGAPQNTVRSAINKIYVNEAIELMKEHCINNNNVICHAPYIINLANNLDSEKYNFSISFLKQELKRCEELGVKYLVVHPGSALKIPREEALINISNALNFALTDTTTTVLLETMAGKGTECGINTFELKSIIDHVDNKGLMGICLDTCHLHDSGVDLNDFEQYLNDFEYTLGLDLIKCVHLNDSKNIRGSHKDRHANIGYGEIGFETLLKICNCDKLKDVPKILETPYVSVNEKISLPPYKYEIESLKNGQFNNDLVENIKDTCCTL